MKSFNVNSLVTHIFWKEPLTFALIAFLRLLTYLDNLHLATKESHFIIKETLYKQVDGVVIGSTFGPTLVIRFLAFHGKHWLKDCRTVFKPVHHQHNVDYIFV